jgi:eukaryotic-like serine/threonine-protein kinase
LYPIQCAAFSSDCRYVLTGGDDRSARLWERESGKQVGGPLWHGDVVRAVAFSPSGNCFATASADATARLWGLPTGQPIGNPLKHQQAISTVAFSADGSLLATGSDDQTARLWDVESGEPIGPPLPPWAKTILLDSGRSTRAFLSEPDCRTGIRSPRSP